MDKKIKIRIMIIALVTAIINSINAAVTKVSFTFTTSSVDHTVTFDGSSIVNITLAIIPIAVLVFLLARVENKGQYIVSIILLIIGVAHALTLARISNVTNPETIDYIIMSLNSAAGIALVFVTYQGIKNVKPLLDGSAQPKKEAE